MLKGVLKNSLITMICRVVSALLSFTTIPIIIKKVGLTGFGLWEVVYSFTLLFYLFQNAINSTSLFYFSSKIESENVSYINRIIGINCFLVLMQVIIFLLLVFSLLNPLISLLSIPVQYKEICYKMIPLALLFVLGNGINDGLFSLLNANGQSGRVSMLYTIGSICNYAITITSLLLNNGVYSMLTGYICQVTIIFFVTFFICRKRFKGIRLSLIIPDATFWNESKKYFSNSLVGNISVILRGQLDKVIMSIFATPAVVGIYSIASKFASLIMEASNFFYIPTIASAGRYYFADNWSEIRNLFSKMNVVVVLVVGGITLFLGLFYEPLVLFWFNKTMENIDFFIIFLIFANSSAVILSGVGTAICKGIGKNNLEARYVTLNMILNIILTITLVKWIGFKGTVIASCVSWIISCFYFIYIFHKKIDLPVKTSIKAIQSLCLIAAIIIGTYFIKAHYNISFVFTHFILVDIGLYFVISFVLICLIGLAVRLYKLQDIAILWTQVKARVI